MTYLDFQTIAFTILAIIMDFVFAGAASIEFQAALKKPSRIELFKFRSKLPKILKWLYFHPHNANVYGAGDHLSGIEHLQTNASILRVCLTWAFVMLLPAAFITGIIRHENYDDLSDVILTIILLIGLLRASLFGIRIERSNE